MAEAELELIQDMYNKYVGLLRLLVVMPADTGHCPIKIGSNLHTQMRTERLSRRRTQQRGICMHRPMRREVHGGEYQDRGENARPGNGATRRWRRPVKLWRLRQIMRPADGG